MIGGNYGAMWRNDGSNFWLLTTASGGQYNSWNSLRPFSINDSTVVYGMLPPTLFASIRDRFLALVNSRTGYHVRRT